MSMETAEITPAGFESFSLWHKLKQRILNPTPAAAASTEKPLVQCNICYSQLEALGITVYPPELTKTNGSILCCGHMFCDECIRQTKLHSETGKPQCPTCRTSFTFPQCACPIKTFPLPTSLAEFQNIHQAFLAIPRTTPEINPAAPPSVPPVCGPCNTAYAETVIPRVLELAEDPSSFIDDTYRAVNIPRKKHAVESETNALRRIVDRACGILDSNGNFVEDRAIQLDIAAMEDCFAEFRNKERFKDVGTAMSGLRDVLYRVHSERFGLLVGWGPWMGCRDVDGLEGPACKAAFEVEFTVDLEVLGRCLGIKPVDIPGRGPIVRFLTREGDFRVERVDDDNDDGPGQVQGHWELVISFGEGTNNAGNDDGEEDEEQDQEDEEGEEEEGDGGESEDDGPGQEPNLGGWWDHAPSFY